MFQKVKYFHYLVMFFLIIKCNLINADDISKNHSEVSNSLLTSTGLLAQCAYLCLCISVTQNSSDHFKNVWLFGYKQNLVKKA